MVFVSAALAFAAPMGSTSAQPVPDWKVRQAGNDEKNVVKGYLFWDISAPFQKGADSNTLTARFTYFGLQKNTSEAIAFIQVSKHSSDGGVDFFPGPGGKEQAAWDAFYAKLAVNGKSDFVDVKKDENPTTALYGLKLKAAGPPAEYEPMNPVKFKKEPDPKKFATWIVGDVEKGSDTRIGYGMGAPGNKGYSPAIMFDSPKMVDARKGKKIVAKFETAVFTIDTNEVLGVISWGFEIPANMNGDFVIDVPTVSKTPSKELHAAVQKANAVFPNKIGAPKAVPNGSGLLGGVSALP